MFDPRKATGKLRAELSNAVVPTPTGRFVPYKRVGRMIYLSGQTCSLHDVMVYRGAVGADLTIEQAQKAARLCMLNLLAALDLALQGNDAKVECLSIKAYVQVVAGISDFDQIIAGATNLLMELGTSTPSWTMQVLGSSALPGDASIEIEAVFITHQ